MLQEIRIGEYCFNGKKTKLVIENYPNLKKITVKKNSFIHVKMLKISKNEKLNMICIQDGGNTGNKGKNPKKQLYKKLQSRSFFLLLSAKVILI